MIKVVEKNKTVDECLEEALSSDRAEFGRPIPAFYSIVSNKTPREEKEKMKEVRNVYSDLLYGWLLTNGIYDTSGDYYYIPKMVASANKISRLINLSRPTITAKLKGMIAAGTIIETADYYKIQVPKTDYFIINQQTLDFMLSTCREDVIQVYAIIGARWKMHKDLNQDACYVSLRGIAEQLGLTITGPNVKKISRILTALNFFGLVDWTETEYNENTVIKITVFNATLEEKRTLTQR